MTISPPPDTGCWIVRQAKLFEAGDYPDKGIQVEPRHLQELAAAFDKPVPILIEHADSPLELGYLTSVRAEGNELFGEVSLSPEADALVRKSGADKLSVGLGPDLDSILEVSLVRNPRVESARLFSGSLLEDWRSRFEALEIDSQIERYVGQGRLTPAQIPIVRALLGHRATVAFGSGAAPVARLIRDFLELQPDRGLFSELAPVPKSEAAHLDPEHADFYRKHFPGLPLDMIEPRSRG